MNYTFKGNALFQSKLIDIAYKNLPPMVFVNVAAAFGAAWTVASGGHVWAWTWLCLMCVLSAIRLFDWARYRSSTKSRAAIGPSRLAYWQQNYGVGLCASAILWAVLACSVIDSEASHSGSVARYTLVIIISALAGGATGVTAALKSQGRLYITILLLPASLALAIFSSVDVIIAALGLIFLVVMLVSHANNHNVLRQSLDLEHDNISLIADLKDLNGTLESKILDRTRALKEIAHNDLLTNLPNRRGLMEWAKALLKDHSNLAVAVMFLDLDRFKQINDALGHDIGDRVLVNVSGQINKQLPPGAILARWGGDEFVVAMPLTAAEPNIVQYLCDRIIGAVNHPFVLNGETIRLGVSIGLAFYPDDDKSFTDVIHAADLAVTEVKRTERGRALAYSETYAEVQRRRYDLSRSLAQAIGTDELTLVYQPIVSAVTGRVVAHEALARWNHPSLGAISPEEFIKLAEDTDKIVALGEWALYQACKDATGWGKDGAQIKVAVNASIKQLVHSQFDLKVVQILNQTGLSPARLEIEVTESLFDDEHLEQVLRCVKNLRELGVEVHIDDFGTGYSSLSRLHKFPVTAIKVDRHFINDIDADGRVIVESAVMIARRFGFEVIAEGVETIEQAQILYELGVDKFQGYYFARPQAEASHHSFAPLWVSETAIAQAM
ncbi:putative bifunctional diguanylate cyclase/phosphodiesterase [Asticcacaulis sp. AC466]|uniref:putative bifunctional diguanylate cyclase/phosphodiesterase n=1 Tax=Asticcacaulis sp. AC466 TaxID=1282362 RepID=UPI00041641C0|nr:EAL domain-containing protein [Asticcacaulis sp. AC466]